MAILVVDAMILIVASAPSCLDSQHIKVVIPVSRKRLCRVEIMILGGVHAVAVFVHGINKCLALRWTSKGRHFTCQT